MTTKKKSAGDDNSKNLPNKKGKVIKPLHEATLKKQLHTEQVEAQNNSDILAELAAKTAALAEKVGGYEAPNKTILSIEPERKTADNPQKKPENLFESREDPIATEVLPPALQQNETAEAASPAVEMIRSKLNRLFDNEPDAETEAIEAKALKNRSKHQDFMYNLTTSGKSLAAIQTEWHEYYVGLNNEEKHEVWQEFYKNQGAASAFNQKKQHDIEVASGNKHQKQRKAEKEALAAQPSGLKAAVSSKVSAKGKLTKKDHFKSLLFGMGLASAVGLVIVFVFFNQVFVAPFISPSKTVSATPIIGNVTAPIGPESKIIIPKINLEVPIVYDVGTVEEDAIQDALEDGVVHYAASPEPGEKGNSVIVGHSSNNILNSGKYKFAFVLLNRLDVDDTFYVHKDGVRYTYKIYDSVVVPPTDVSVLGPAEKPNSITLITCDPPGTSINRLIIVAEQISPNPSENTVADIQVEPESVEDLPSDAPSFFSRLWPF